MRNQNAAKVEGVIRGAKGGSKTGPKKDPKSSKKDRKEKPKEAGVRKSTFGRKETQGGGQMGQIGKILAVRYEFYGERLEWNMDRQMS